jgi:hypothetical protein
METAISRQDERSMVNFEDHAMTSAHLISQVQLIKNVMEAVMRNGVHYGTIPGCGDKPTLLQPGAQKLCLTFRLAPTYEIITNDFPGGHREYDVICTLKSIVTNEIVGSGVGCCSTLEGRYRYRQETTGKEVPNSYWKTRNPDELGGTNCKPQKREGKWVIVQRVEHDNPADYWNTCKKMAIKRALVSAIIQTTAASDIFTQDVEDMVENGITPAAETAPVISAAPAVIATPAKKTTPTQQIQPEPQTNASNNDIRPLTEGQVKLLYAQAGKSKDKEKIIDGLKEIYGVEHLKDIPGAEMNNAIAFIKDRLEEGK